MTQQNLENKVSQRPWVGVGQLGDRRQKSKLFLTTECQKAKELGGPIPTKSDGARA